MMDPPAVAVAKLFAVAEGKQKKISQRIVLDVYLTAPGSKVRKSYAGELRRLHRLGFREAARRLGSREDHLKITLEREVERFPGVPVADVPPYIQ
jgi:hypothetical protein